MEKKHIPLVVGVGVALLATASLCCCGGWVLIWPATPRVAGTPLRADEFDFISEAAPDAEAELEVLPKLRTGLTREQGKAMLTVGTLKEWKVMTPEGHLAICRLAARRLYPSGDDEIISSRSRNYVLMLDEMAYSGKHNEKEKIGGMIAFEDAMYRSIDAEPPTTAKRRP